MNYKIFFHFTVCSKSTKRRLLLNRIKSVHISQALVGRSFVLQLRYWLKCVPVIRMGVSQVELFTRHDWLLEFCSFLRNTTRSYGFIVNAMHHSELFFLTRHHSDYDAFILFLLRLWRQSVVIIVNLKLLFSIRGVLCTMRSLF